MLTIYGVPLSVHARKAIVAVLLKGLDHRVEPVVPFDPPVGWRDLSPTGLIPALRDGERVIADSSVICAYLDRAYPQPALYPADTDGLVRALWLEEYCDGSVFRHVVHPLFFQRVIRPGLLGQATDQEAVDAVLGEALPRHFGYLEDQVGGGWLAGDAFSVADIAVASNLLNYRYLGYEIDAYLYPRLAGYLGRALAHPGLRRAVAAERPFAERMGLDSSFLA